MKTKKPFLILTALLLIIFVVTFISCSRDVPKKEEAGIGEAEKIVNKEITILDIEGKEINKGQVEIYITTETKDTQPNITIVELDNELLLPFEGSNSIGKPFWIISERGLDGPVIVTISYNLSDLPPGAKEENLFIAILENDSWGIVEKGIIDTENKAVSIAVNHFSVFGTFEGEIDVKYEMTAGESSLESRIGLLGSLPLPKMPEEKTQVIPVELPKGIVYLKGEAWCGKKISLTLDFDQKRFSGSVSLDNKDTYIKETTGNGYIESDSNMIEFTGHVPKVTKKDSSVVGYDYKIVVVINKEMSSVQGFLLDNDWEDGAMRGKEFKAERIEKPEKEIVVEKVEKEYTEQSQEIEEESLPSEPITYSGDALGLAVVLIVDFKTTVVTGSVSLSGDFYVDATITNGKIDIETFEITANFSGIMGSGEYGGIEEPFNGTITGIISEDLSTFNGVILDDEGDGGDFTLNK